MPITKQPHHHTASAQQGFTMVVIAALFIAFAVIAAAAVERNTTTQQITRRDAAIAQLNRLSAAIIEYSVFNKSGTTLLYPCPALPGDTYGSANFGAATTNCATVDTATIDIFTPDVIRGVVPVKELSGQGINANDMFDPWNNRIMYVVNRTLTTGGTSSQTNNPTIADAGANVTIAKPDFILISYGRDGVGAIRATASSATPAITCTNGTTTLRLENCDNDANFVVAPTYTASDATAGTYFDDILTYYRQ